MDEFADLLIDPLAFGRILLLELRESLFVGSLLVFLHRAKIS